MAKKEEELQFPLEKTIGLDFARLKSYCLELFDLLRNPKKDAAFLSEMVYFLRRTPAPTLQTSLDYIILPLLLLLDSAVQCRKKKANSDGDPLGFIEIRDSVVEGMLMCLEELFKKCYLGSVDQMVVVLKKLSYGAMLSPTEASEEFRGGIIKCFRAMLLTLQPCSNSSCICKQRVVLPTIEPFITTSISYNTHLSYQVEPQECLLAFLQSQNASAAVGHWLSLLHQAAELEALRGHHGNANIRKEAFLALRVLVAKVGTADALAFFLPGVVSHFTKALCESKNTIGGAAGSTGATEHALRGLTEFLITVLDDKANPYAIEVPMNDTMTLSPEENKSTQSVLETLRCLPSNSTHIKSSNVTGDFLCESVEDSSPMVAYDRKFADDSKTKRILFVHRSKVWLDETSTNVDKAIHAAFPYLSVHPSEKIREAIVDGIKGILSSCRQTLQRSKLMLLECLCVLASGDDVVSISAQEALESLFVLDDEFVTKFEVSEMLSRLIKELPRVVLGNDEIAALTHAQKLLSLIYFAGPDLLVDHLFHSPINSSHFLECLGLCLSHNSQYAGSMKKLRWLNPLSTGYLLSISELKASSLLVSSSSLIYNASPPVVPRISILQDEDSQSASVVDCVREFPHMPPWFGIVGSKKLYLRLAGILRLTGLSIISGYRSIMSLSVVVDQLLDHVRQLTQNIRMKEYGKVGWRTWFHQHGSGHLLRKTSVAVCMLNEIIYGLSEQSVNTYSELFKKSKGDIIQGKDFTYDDGRPLWHKSRCSTWKFRMEKNSWDHIVLSVGKILHEYLSSEVWGIPQNQNELILEDEQELEPALYFFHDTIMLHQVILDGVGIFGILLGNDFVRSGFLHSSLYLLLRNLVTSRGEIKIASDAVLRVLSISSGHATVGKFVVANADYIIDPLCRQLRHLDINPHVPDVLAAMLSYIGSACDIIPLMEEPMRVISSELEVLGRHQHPNLTIPFLKAVGEIAKVSKSEVSLLPNQAELFYTEVDSMVVVIQKWIKENHVNNSSPFTKSLSLEKASNSFDDVTCHMEYWEQLVFKLAKMRSYRRIVGSLVGSCLKVAAPLVSSQKEPACLVALDIIEDVSVSLAKVEEAYKHEKNTEAAIVEATKLLSLTDLKYKMDSQDVEGDENRVLPAMNKIWPYLILCLTNKVSVATIQRCLQVLYRGVQIGGGDFFIRRFHNDGNIIWKLLVSFPFRRKQMASDEKRILLPYRDTAPLEESMAEISSLKVQAAVLDMITMICLDDRASSALRTVLKKISGITVGIACNSMASLRDSSIRALSALARIDSDLIWLLLADVYYSLRKDDCITPSSLDLRCIYDLLPAPLSLKEYLFVNYAGENFGFDVDPSAVELVFRTMVSENFW